MPFLASGQNLITNGDFESGYSNGWNHLAGDGASATYSDESASPYEGSHALKNIITTLGANSWSIQSLGPTVTLTVGEAYTLTFWGKAAASGTQVRMVIQNTVYTAQTYNLGTAWTQYTWNFTAQETSPSIRLQYPQVGTVWLDDIQLTADTPPPPVNTPPVADSQSVSTPQDTALSITLTASDADSDPLTHTVLTQPANGGLTGSAPDLTYTPDPGYTGSDSFTFKANDGADDSNTATVSITVIDPNSSVTITVSPQTQHQEMVGFGACFSWYETFYYAGNNAKDAAINQVMFQDSGLDILRIKNWYYPGETDYAIPEAAKVANDAKAINPDIQILLSSWSPPASLKSNGQRENGGTLKSDAGGYMYDELAAYWVDALTNMGWTPDYLSFQNEPGWTATWESCLFDNTEGARASYGTALDTIWNAIKDMPNCPKIVATDAENMGSFLNRAPYLEDKTYIDVNGFHTYDVGSTSAIDSASTISKYNQIRAKNSNRPNWVTEFSKEGWDWITIARMIHNVVVEADCSAYIYWKLGWDHWTSTDAMLGLTGGGDFVINPHYYTIKHYAKHVDKGYKRIEIGGSNANVKVSGYISPDLTNITLVAINKSGSTEQISLNHSLSISSSEGYQSVTDSYWQTMTGLDVAQPIGLPANSMTTLVLTLSSPYNPPPVANGANLHTPPETALPITLSAQDPDNEPLTYSIVSTPTNGILSGTAPNVTYTPDNGFTGSDSFTFKANDGTQDSNIATISITVGQLSPLVLYEPFDYAATDGTPAEAATLEGNNGGTGWSGAWVVDDDGGAAGVDDEAFEVISPGLSFGSLPVQGNAAGRIAANTNNRAIAYRTLSTASQAALLSDNTTVWFSVLYRDAGTGDDFAFIISNQRHNAGGADPALVSAGDAFGFASINSSIHATKHDNATVQALSAGTLSANTGTFLLAGKINWKSDGTADELFLFNITDPASSEPAQETAFATLTGDFDQSTFNLISMWDRPGTPGQLDEIRFGDSFATVMGQSATTYIVSYDANSADTGDVPIDANSPYDAGATVTVLGNTGNLTKAGYSFAGWNTAANGSGIGYLPASTFTITGNVTLYAQWAGTIADVDLPAGISLYGYTGESSIDAQTAFQTLINNNQLSLVRWINPSGFIKELYYTTFPSPAWTNEIGDLTLGQGYVVKVTEACTLSIDGNKSTGDVTHDLPAGYSLLGYNKETPVDAETAFQELITAGKLDLVRWVDPSTGGIKELYFTSFPSADWVNEIGNLQEGQGYIIKLNASHSGFILP